jgi:BirA family biotin operon repressor/biotin-[acetyl-CoA-carboxylase] ligase
MQWQGRSVREWQQEWRLPELHIFAVTTSTNDVARERVLAGASAGTTVMAESQSAGRGRSGRPWSDVHGKSVMLSVVMRSAARHVDPTVMPIRVGLAVARAIEAVSHVRVLLKWPNDLVLATGAKLGGILCEGAVANDASWLVAGIGINALQEPHEFPPELQGTAVSLLAAGARVQRARLVGAMLDALRPFEIAPPPLDEGTLLEIAERDALRGHTVTLDGEIAGIASGIAADGTLLISAAHGMRSIRNGTVRVAKALNNLSDVSASPTVTQPHAKTSHAPDH